MTAPRTDRQPLNSTLAQMEPSTHDRARGVPLSQAKKVGPDGNLQAWIEDPDGNRIELMQMAPNGLQLQAIRRLRAEATSGSAR
jgi:lactoylglutathione lyase